MGAISMISLYMFPFLKNIYFFLYVFTTIQKKTMGSDGNLVHSLCSLNTIFH